MDQNRLAVSGQEDVRRTRVSLGVKSVTKTHSVHEATNYKLWLSVLASDGSHVCTSLRSAVDIQSVYL
jgi:hypothetical protein